PDVMDAVTAEVLDETKRAMSIGAKSERNTLLDEILSAVTATLVGSDDAPGQFAGREKEIKSAFRSLQKKVVRTRIVEEGVRIDGRGTSDIRPLSADV